MINIKLRTYFLDICYWIDTFTCTIISYCLHFPCTVPFRNKRPKIYAKYAYAYAYIRICVCVYTRMRMRICAYTLCARMLISMYKLAGLFFLLLIVDCSFNDPTLRHLKVHGRMNKSCRAKESLHVYFYRKY